jgi:uncharacterized membrane protein YdjX (TVP38/TMEM64 family)
VEHDPPEDIPRDRRLLALRAVAALLLTGAFVGLAVAGLRPSATSITTLGDDLGPAAPVLWPLVVALANFVVPWALLAGASGLLFGTAAGTALAMTGILLATALQFTAARTLAGQHLRDRVHRRLPRVEALLRRSGGLAVFYSRIAPLVPWVGVNYAAGFSRVGLRAVLVATLVGGLPKVFAYTALGGSLSNLLAPEGLVAIGLLVVMSIGGAILARRQLADLRAP